MSQSRPENARIAAHLANTESTMEWIASTSAGMSLLRLKERYGEDLSDESVDSCLETARSKFTQTSSEDSEAAISYFFRIISDKPNQLDSVTLYLPDADDTASYHEVMMVFPLKQVFVLVWRALCDTYTYDQETIADHQRGLLNVMVQLKNDPICHHGVRHELLSQLNKIHKDVNFIVSADAFFMEHYRHALREPLRTALANPDVEVELNTAIITWLENGDATELFKQLHITDGTRKELERKLIEHGVNPNADHVVERFNHAMECATFISDLDVARDNALRHLEALLTLVSGNEIIQRAHGNVVGWLKNDYYLGSENDRRVCALHYAIFTTAQKLERYNALITAGTALSDDEQKNIAVAQGICDAHMNAIVNGNNPSWLEPAQAEILKCVRGLLERVGSDKLVAFIENIFSVWQVAVNREILTRRLLDKEVQRKILLDDKGIKSWLTTDEAGEAHFSPYQINRIFLHAIFTEVETWTDDFSHICGMILAFVKNKFDQINSHASQLQHDSYPDELLEQLDYLHAHYQFIKNRQNTDAGNPPKQPDRLFMVNPANIRTINQWCQFAKDADEQLRESAFRSKRDILLVQCRNSEDKEGAIAEIMPSLPTRYKLRFLLDAFAINLILLYAAVNGDTDIVPAILASEHCDTEVLKQKKNRGTTALISAATRDHAEIVEAILTSRHCDAEVLKQQDRNGMTALISAAACDHAEIVEAILTSRHCDAEVLKQQDRFGTTALMWTLINGHAESIKAILTSKHCDAEVLKQKNNTGTTALMWTTVNGHAESSKAILTSKHCDAEVLKQQDRNGMTALMRAARMNHLESIKAILASKHCDAEVLKQKDIDSMTALMWAARMNHLESIKAILASKHCDTEMLKQQDSNSSTASDCARDNNHTEIADAIDQRLAELNRRTAALSFFKKRESVAANHSDGDTDNRSRKSRIG